MASGDGDGDEVPGDGDGNGISDGDGAPGNGDGDGDPRLGCNGQVELCDRAYDQVVFAGTHNSHAAISES